MVGFTLLRLNRNLSQTFIMNRKAVKNDVYASPNPPPPTDTHIHTHLIDVKNKIHVLEYK